MHWCPEINRLGGFAQATASELDLSDVHLTHLIQGEVGGIGVGPTGEGGGGVRGPHGPSRGASICGNNECPNGVSAAPNKKAVNTSPDEGGVNSEVASSCEPDLAENC